MSCPALLLRMQEGHLGRYEGGRRSVLFSLSWLASWGHEGYDGKADPSTEAAVCITGWGPPLMHVFTGELRRVPPGFPLVCSPRASTTSKTMTLDTIHSHGPRNLIAGP